MINDKIFFIKYSPFRFKNKKSAASIRDRTRKMQTPIAATQKLNGTGKLPHKPSGICTFAKFSFGLYATKYTL